MALSKIKEELSGFDWHDLKNAEAIGNWPPVVKAAVQLALLLLSVALGDQVIVGGLRDELNVLVDEGSMLRQELEQKLRSAADIPAQRTAALSNEKDLARFMRQLPEGRQIPDLLESITAVGHASRLTFSSVDLAEEQVKAFYIEQSVRMEVLGTYHDFAGFISGVAALQPLVTLHDFSIERQHNELLHISFELQIYHQHGGLDGIQHSSSGKPSPVSLLSIDSSKAPVVTSSGVRYGGASLRSPFDEMSVAASAEAPPVMMDSSLVPDASRPAQPLERFTLATLHMVGSIARGPVTQALIRDDSGMVHRVAVGQYMGHDYGRVQRITARKIELMEVVRSGDGWSQRPRTLLLQQQLCRQVCGAGEEGDR